MSKIYADTKFVGVWKCLSKVKAVEFNKTNVTFQDKAQYVTFSNTQGGTIMYFGTPEENTGRIIATRAADNAVEFIFKAKDPRFIIKEHLIINLMDNSTLKGQSTVEYLTKQGTVAKVKLWHDYKRMGRMQAGG